jgi:hypothetical protein
LASHAAPAQRSAFTGIARRRRPRSDRSHLRRSTRRRSAARARIISDGAIRLDGGAIGRELTARREWRRADDAPSVAQSEHLGSDQG